MIAAVNDVAPSMAISAACRALRLPRATYYRRKKPKPAPLARRQNPSLSTVERQAVLELLHQPRFVDLAPAQVYAVLLDEGRHHCSERTMYRILAANRETRERRDQLRASAYSKPHVVAKGPNELWSWTSPSCWGRASGPSSSLRRDRRLQSLTVVGWMVAHRELSLLAQRLLADCSRRQRIQSGQLTVHADRGTSMMSKPVALCSLTSASPSRTHDRSLQRQPLLRGPVQDAQVSPELPIPIRFNRRRTRSLRRFRPVQRRASSCRHRPAHAERRSSRPRRPTPRPSLRRAARRFRSTPRAISRTASPNPNNRRTKSGSTSQVFYSNPAFNLSHPRWQLPEQDCAGVCSSNVNPNMQRWGSERWQPGKASRNPRCSPPACASFAERYSDGRSLAKRATSHQHGYESTHGAEGEGQVGPCWRVCKFLRVAQDACRIPAFEAYLREHRTFG